MQHDQKIKALARMAELGKLDEIPSVEDYAKAEAAAAQAEVERLRQVLRDIRDTQAPMPEGDRPNYFQLLLAFDRLRDKAAAAL